MRESTSSLSHFPKQVVIPKACVHIRVTSTGAHYAATVCSGAKMNAPLDDKFLFHNAVVERIPLPYRTEMGLQLDNKIISVRSECVKISFSVQINVALSAIWLPFEKRKYSWCVCTYVRVVVRGQLESRCAMDSEWARAG